MMQHLAWPDENYPRVYTLREAPLRTIHSGFCCMFVPSSQFLRCCFNFLWPYILTSDDGIWGDTIDRSSYAATKSDVLDPVPGPLLRPILPSLLCSTVYRYGLINDVVTSRLRIVTCHDLLQTWKRLAGVLSRT
jgi:hypothetical protein